MPYVGALVGALVGVLALPRMGGDAAFGPRPNPPKIWVYASGSGGGALVGAGWCSALVGGALAPGALVGLWWGV